MVDSSEVPQFYLSFVTKLDEIEKRELLNQISSMLSCGKTVREIAEHFGTDYFSIYRLTREFSLEMSPRKGHRIPSEKMAEVKRMLLQTNMTAMEIARSLGLSSRSSIYNLRNKLFRDSEREAEHSLSFRVQSKRCEIHGLVTVWPCVACEAVKHRKQNV